MKSFPLVQAIRKGVLRSRFGGPNHQFVLAGYIDCSWPGVELLLDSSRHEEVLRLPGVGDVMTETIHAEEALRLAQTGDSRFSWRQG